jgi:DHA1 family bicyclomycin/chloramphenicol resistance-like MFS transporter
LPDAKKYPDFQFEFVALMASLSVVALAIDALLPALDIIGITIGTTEVVDKPLITMIFLVLDLGLWFRSPSDSFVESQWCIWFCLVYCASSV